MEMQKKKVTNVKQKRSENDISNEMMQNGLNAIYKKKRFFFCKMFTFTNLRLIKNKINAIFD